MKMLPITFRESYNSTNSSSEVLPGFYPFKDEFCYHDIRHVDITALGWNFGTYFVFDIVDTVFPEDSGKCEKKLYSFLVFDRPNNVEGNVVPTVEQAILMGAIGSGDIRGSTALYVVKELYIDLFALNPKTGFKDYLPLVYDFWIKHDMSLKSK